MERTILSFSIVSTLWERYNRDYLDNFVPFIATLFKNHSISKFNGNDIANFVDLFYSDFGLKIPYHSFITIINKCKKLGLIRKSFNEYIVIRSKLLDYEFSSEEGHNNQLKNNFINRFIKFSKDSFGTDIDEATAEDVLLCMLKNNDMDIIISASKKSLIPQINLPRKYKQYQYLLYTFFIHLFENGDPLYKYLTDLSFGHLISSTILLEDYQYQSDTVKGCEIYLDTPIILKLLGSEGIETSKIYKDHLTDYKTNGAVLKIFSHTKNEIYEILDSAKDWVESSEFNPSKANRTTLYFRQEGYNRSQVEAFINKVEKVLLENSISVEEIPPFEGNEKYQIDEKKLHKIIENLLLESNPGFDANFYKIRTKRDVDSISAIYRLRQNNCPRFLRDAKYCFVTTNNLLTVANLRYNKSIELPANLLPACLTDIFIGTVLWIKQPKSAKKEMREKFISDCYLALRPDPILEKRLIDEANRLLSSQEIGKDDHILLTTSFLTKELLNEKTLSDLSNFESKTTFEILEEIKEKIREEERGKFNQLSKEYDTIKYEKEILQKEKDKDNSAIRNIIHVRANFNAKLNNILKGIIIFGSICIPIPFSFFINPIFVVISVLSGIVTAIFSFVNGFKFKSNYQKIYSKMTTKLFEKYSIEN